MSALLAFALSPLGRYIVIGAAALALGFGSGWSLKSRLDAAATYRALIAKLAVDLNASNKRAERALAVNKDLEQTNATNAEKLRDLQLATGNDCPLPDDVARRLRGLQR